MARYRANNHLFIDGDRFIEPGEEFTSDLQPGRNWEPLDAAAKAAVAKMQEARGGLHKQADEAAQRIFRTNPKPAAVDIPDDWQSQSKAKKRGIAMKLGAPGTVSAADAETFITAELERRAQKAA